MKDNISLGEGICSVYIQPEGFGPPPQQQQGGYRKEFSRSYQQTVDRQYTNGSSNITTEDFKVIKKKSYIMLVSSRWIKVFYCNDHLLLFQVDTFEYRLLRETEFRESITRRYVGETDTQISTTVERNLGPVSPPQITQKPRNSKLTEGSEAVFIARISGNPKPRVSTRLKFFNIHLTLIGKTACKSNTFLLQLTWFKDGQRLRESHHIETVYSNQQAQLKIHRVASEDTGHYSLLTENPQGCTVSSAYLAVESSDQVDHVPIQSVQTSKEVITTFQSDPPQNPLESESAKVLAPNFVRTCSDRDVTEGKMTR